MVILNCFLQIRCHPQASELGNPCMGDGMCEGRNSCFMLRCFHILQVIKHSLGKKLVPRLQAGTQELPGYRLVLFVKHFCQQLYISSCSFPLPKSFWNKLNWVFHAKGCSFSTSPHSFSLRKKRNNFIPIQTKFAVLLSYSFFSWKLNWNCSHLYNPLL